MKYGIISIDLGSVNLGNRLIEFCVKKLMGLPEPAVAVSMFKQITEDELSKLNACDFVLLPGSTILAKGKGESFALSSLSRIKVPIICTAASIWSPKYTPYYEIFKYIKTPIGCRDPITKKILDQAGVKNIFVGCPTAYINEKSFPSSGSLLFGFHRGFPAWQCSLVKKLQTKNNVFISVQERYEKEYAKKTGCNFFTYENPENVLKVYGKCRGVYTGRLHGALPALGQRVPIVFFGDILDSRFSLLKYLGVPINKIGSSSLAKVVPNNYEKQLHELQNKFLEWKKLVL